jgi:DNA-binding CsgD family transcriptional regulator
LPKAETHLWFERQKKFGGISNLPGFMEREGQAVTIQVRGSLMPMPATSRSESSNRAIRLTKREIEVLSLIAQGHSSKEAADALYVSKRTVDFHLANIYDKLQVNNRVQAFRAATRLGLIPFEPTFGHTRGDA